MQKAGTLCERMVEQHRMIEDGAALDRTPVVHAVAASVAGTLHESFVAADGALIVLIAGSSAPPPDGRALADWRAAVRRDPTPLAILALLIQEFGGGNAPAIVARYDPRTAVLSYALAGAGGPLVGTRDGALFALPGQAGHLWEFSLEPNSLVVLAGYLAVGGAAFGEAVRAQARRPGAHSARSIARRLKRPDTSALISFATPAQLADRFSFISTAVPVAAPLARHAFRRFASSLHIPAARRFALELAVGEAIANAVEHAYAARRGHVRVAARREGPRLLVVVEDDGAWKPGRAGDEHGRGIALMRRLMDEVEIHYDEMRTSVRLAMVLDRGVPRKGT